MCLAEEKEEEEEDDEEDEHTLKKEVKKTTKGLKTLNNLTLKFFSFRMYRKS